MSAIPRWFDRQFEFTFPVEQFPSLATRLRGTPARLEEMMQGCTPEILVRKPHGQEGGKWSAQEHAGHLFDLEPLWMKRVDDFTAGGSELTAADLSNRKTDEANHNARPVEGILADFRTARLELVNRISDIEPASISRSMLHPRLKKPMRLVDHLFFAAEHDDHHLAWIWALIHRKTR